MQAKAKAKSTYKGKGGEKPPPCIVDLGFRLGGGLGKVLGLFLLGFRALLVTDGRISPPGIPFKRALFF